MSVSFRSHLKQLKLVYKGGTHKLNKLKTKATIVKRTRVCSSAAGNERNENWRTFELSVSVRVSYTLLAHFVSLSSFSVCARVRLLRPGCTKCETVCMCSRNEDRRVYFEPTSILFYLLLRQPRKCLRESSASRHVARSLTGRSLSRTSEFSFTRGFPRITRLKFQTIKER